jgi:N-acetylglutamate synthase-like GNAT family acetyltransferase
LPEIRACLSSLDREQAFDIRRSVLCGELHLNREAAKDDDDEHAYLAIAWEGEKPVGTGRLLQRGDFWVLEHLCVLPEQRRQGVAKALIGHFQARAAGQGAAEILVVSPVQSSAFFLKAGFAMQGSQADLVVLKRGLRA